MSSLYNGEQVPLFEDLAFIASLRSLLKPPRPLVKPETGIGACPLTVNQRQKDGDTHNQDGYFDLMGGSGRYKNSDDR
jgi:hypothetical protein